MMRIFGMAPLRFDFKLIIDYIKGKTNDPSPLLEFRDELANLILGYLVQSQHLARHRIIFKKLEQGFIDDVSILTTKLSKVSDSDKYDNIVEKLDGKRRLLKNLGDPSIAKLFEFKDRSKSANEKIVKISELNEFLRLTNNKKKDLLMEFIDDNCIVVKDEKISW
jgi:hypothetical protein